MKKLTLKLGSAFASASLVATLLAPAAYADTTVDVLNNGAGSTNTVTVENKAPSVELEQKNSTSVEAVVVSTANSGDNTANKNVTNDGDVAIETGKATATAGLSVVGGDNAATIGNNCGCPSDTTVTVEKNGADSNNTVTVKNGSKKPKKVSQKTRVRVAAVVDADANSGRNKTNKNVTGGSGSVLVTTDDALSGASIGVSAGDNTVTL